MDTKNYSNLVEYFYEPESRSDESCLKEVKKLCFAAYHAKTPELAQKTIENAKVFVEKIKNPDAKKRAENCIKFVQAPKSDGFYREEVKRLCIKAASVRSSEEKSIYIQRAKIIADRIKNEAERTRTAIYINYVESKNNSLGASSSEKTPL